MELGKFISVLCTLLSLVIITKTAEEDCNCGETNPSRIIGGAETGEDEYPMMAALITLPRKKYFCGGTIITSKHIFTSAHCVNRFKNDKDRLGIVIGEHDLSKDDETDATKIYKVDNIKTHPQYDASNNINDVAVVTLKENMQFTMKVKKVCLPFKYTWDEFKGETVTALGWGSSKPRGKVSNTLQKVDLNIIPINDCKGQKMVTNDMLCTEKGEKDACTFDMGGPLLWKNKTSSQMMLIGVISVEGCGSKQSVSMRTTSYLDFIKSQTPGYNYCNVY